MSLAEVALWAFTCVNAIRVASYLPQMIKIWRDTSGASGVSYTTWGMFAVSHFTTVTYAVFTLGDAKMAWVFVGNFVSCVVILGLTAWKQGKLTPRNLLRVLSLAAPSPVVWKAVYAFALVSAGGFVGASLNPHAPWARLMDAKADPVSAATLAGPGGRAAGEESQVAGTVTPVPQHVAAFIGSAPVTSSVVQGSGSFVPPGFSPFQLLMPGTAAAAFNLPAERVDVPATLDRAEKALRSGNVQEARLLFGRVDEVNNGRGAAGLARSYDPRVLAGLPGIGEKGDRAEMQRWHARAAQLGQRPPQSGPTIPSAR